MNEIDPMASQSLDPNETNRIRVSPHRRELITTLSEKYRVSHADAQAIGRTGLLRIADTFDFLSNNLPANSRLK
jgi:hypothetical protein